MLNSIKEMLLKRMASFLNYVWDNAFTGANMDTINKILGKYSNCEHLVN